MKKKIVLFGLNGRGGMLHYASQYANALAEIAEVYIVLPTYSRTDLFSKKVKFLKIKAPSSYIGTAVSCATFWNHRNLIKKINHLNPDYLHCMDDHPFYLYYLKKLNKIPFCVTLHDVLFHEGEHSKISSIVDKKIHNYYYKHASKIIVHGEKQKKILVKRGIDSKKIIVSFHGTYDFFTKWKTKNTKTDNSSFLFFGRIMEYKGLDTLLCAIKVLSKDNLKFTCVIAGEGDISKYSLLNDSDVKKHVKLINKYVAEEKTAAFFQRTSFVVLPYKSATQSGIIPIAFSFKKTAIATDVGSISDVVINNNTGLLIKPNDSEELAKSIKYLLVNPSKSKKMGEAGYKFMKKELDWKNISKKIFKELFNKK